MNAFLFVSDIVDAYHIRKTSNKVVAKIV